MMDYSKYMELIYKGKNEEAIALKNAYVPDVLYKYYSLDERLDLNNKKLQCLQEAKVYLSEFKEFNDPFEGKFLIFDEEKLKEKGWDRNQVESYYMQMASLFRIGCLSNTSQQNMPMWAYYANSHKGFCVEYEISEKQKKYIFPIAYESERLYANSIITHLINGFWKMIKEGKSVDETPTELNIYQQLMFLSFATKHNSWEHEQEYRIMNQFDKYFPMTPKKIFIGKDCKKEYQKRLIDVAHSFGTYCEVYQMELERDSESFDLTERLL